MGTAILEKPPTRSQRRLLEAARKVMGENADVRAAAAGRANARWSRGARVVVGIFAVAFVLGVVLIHVILVPGVLVVVIVIETTVPRRCVIVTGTEVADLELSLVRARPTSVIAVANHAALFDSRLDRGQSGKSVVAFGTETVSLRRKDVERLRMAARTFGGPIPGPQLVPLPPPPSLSLLPQGRAPAARTDPDAIWAGVTALVGASLRATAYGLPWIVLRTTTVNASDGRAIGVSILTIWFSILSGVAAIIYLSRRSKRNAQMLAGIGVIVAVGSLLSFVSLFEKVEDVRSFLSFPGLDARVSIGVGPWVQLLASLFVLAGGMWAARIARRTPASVTAITEPSQTPS